LIFVSRPKPEDPKWQDFWQEADKAGQALLKAFEPKTKIKFKEDFYKRYMSYLHRLFRGKCAYCEEKLSGQPGDVEHFRPKGRVCDAEFHQVMINHPKWGSMPHPGYYWLAYDWDNLLPSCADCNRFRWYDKEMSGGKADRFPVKGPHAYDPDGLSKEKPLLIDPSKEDPTRHLRIEFDSVTESIIYRAKTDEGETTIETFGLNKREQLVKQRTRAFADAQEAFRAYANIAGEDNNKPELERRRKRINEMLLGDDQYTAVQRAALFLMRERYKKNNVEIPLPIPEPRQERQNAVPDV
jgi:uncharacterized protein (TIGR02646 family)